MLRLEVDVARLNVDVYNYLMWVPIGGTIFRYHGNYGSDGRSIGLMLAKLNVCCTMCSFIALE